MARWQRWGFIARARLERELWEAFERGEDLEAKTQALREAVEEGDVSGPISPLCLLGVDEHTPPTPPH